MDEKRVSATVARKALTRLDELIETKTEFILGGGGAMILAHGFPLATADLDAIPKNLELSKVDVYVKKIAKELNIPADWLNPYFSTFLYTLPQDYPNRFIKVFEGSNITVLALGATDMLILKCFAGRLKDVAHAKALVKRGADIPSIEKHMDLLKSKGIPGVEKALEFLDDILDQV